MSENRSKPDQYQLRFPPGMRERIKDAADQNGRSMNAEILASLDEKYTPPPSGMISLDNALRIYTRLKDGNFIHSDWEKLPLSTQFVVSRIMVYENEVSKADALPDDLTAFWEAGRNEARKGDFVKRIALDSPSRHKAYMQGFSYQWILQRIDEQVTPEMRDTWFGKLR